jgi:hypothetical protein
MARAEGDALTGDDRDEAEGQVEDSVGNGPKKTLTKNRNSRVHTVVSADTPCAIFTTPSDSVARRGLFDNWRLAAEQGFTPIIAQTEFQNRGSEHEHAFEFHPNKFEVEKGLQKVELAVLLKGAAR